jgi:hypothetical protein
LHRTSLTISPENSGYLAYQRCHESVDVRVERDPGAEHGEERKSQSVRNNGPVGK